MTWAEFIALTAYRSACTVGISCMVYVMFDAGFWISLLAGLGVTWLSEQFDDHGIGGMDS